MNAPPVVLLHGLRHTALSMRKIERALDEADRTTLNIGYPSARYPIEKLAVMVRERMCSHFDTGRWDFAAHSMGCILVRLIARDHPGMLRRGVMLAPPNQGSELVDRFIRCPPARWIMGPAGRSLGVAPDSIPNTLGPAGFEAGIIAGSKPDNPFSRFFIDGMEDGRVSVERTYLDGMTDHMVVPHGHFFIMRKKDVVHQTLHFLEHGHFQRGN